MSLKDVFLKITGKQNASAKEDGVSHPIPNQIELAEFRNDCAEGRNNRVKKFLDKYSDTYVEAGKYGWSPLRLAEWRGQSETVQLLKNAYALSCRL